MRDYLRRGVAKATERFFFRSCLPLRPWLRPPPIPLASDANGDEVSHISRSFSFCPTADLGVEVPPELGPAGSDWRRRCFLSWEMLREWALGLLTLVCGGDNGSHEGMATSVATCSEQLHPQPLGQVGVCGELEESNGVSVWEFGCRNQRWWHSKQLTWPQLRQGISIPSTTSPHMTHGSFVGRGCRGLQLEHRRIDWFRRWRLEGVSGVMGGSAKIDLLRG